MAAYREPFESYVHPARTANEFWRLGVGVVLCVFVYVTVLLSLDGFANAVTESGAPRFDQIQSSPWSVIYLLYSFCGMALGPLVIAPLLHSRLPITLFGPRGSIRSDFVTAVKVTVIIQGVLVIVWLLFADTDSNLSPDRWVVLLPFALIGLAIQTGAEEILFRGYLMQQLAARLRSPWIWAAAPSLLFAWLHYDDSLPDLDRYLIMLAIAIYALIATDLVTVTGNIGAAWGMHFAINFSSLLILSPEGWLSGLALFTVPIEDGSHGWLVMLDTAVLLIAWVVLRQRVPR